LNMRRSDDSTNEALEQLLSHPALWRARDRTQPPADEGQHASRHDVGQRPATVSSGITALDQCLPDGGWPTGALIELLHGICGIGELSLLLPAIAQAICGGRWLVCVMPPYQIAASAMQLRGIDPDRVLMVRDCSYDESIWASEQAMRSAACGAVLIWSQATEKNSGAAKRYSQRAMRRLQLAARNSDALVVLFRDVHARSSASAAAVRVQLHPRDSGLDVELFKSRGGPQATVHVHPWPVVPTPAPP
jgi:cell division inhibitor SulA/protein ImuA